MDNPSHVLRILSFLPLFSHHQLPVRPIAPLFFHSSGYCSGTHVLDGHPFPLVLFTPTRACRCKPVHFSAFALRTSTCLAVVTIRTLVLPGPPAAHAANPNMHKSATSVLVTGVAITASRKSISNFLRTSVHARSNDRTPLELHTTRTRIP